MKTIGFIGGISWESTVEYYRIINQEVNKRLGGTHSAKIIMYSFDFDEIDQRNKRGDFEGIGHRLVEEALKLENTGAELLILGANTAHWWANEIQNAINIPLVHIADATGKAIQSAGIKDLLLLGTKYTMEEDFMKGKFKMDYGLNIHVPEQEQREKISRIIFDELIVGKFLEPSKQYILEIIESFPGISGVILGCTELPLIVKKNDIDIPLFNTTELHALAVVDAALK
ncbi:MAG: aspartate/glutamate racemase family protein [Bacteroidales bacterium]|nr:aspartate/glutamate racemase family protein [Bacteroidales bacterium]MCF8406164.1 aspartate/glutamate racemase family protein [Bacteroidales bacterium]